MNNNQLIIYQTEDGKVKIETHFENETVWLNIDQIAELFQKSCSTINEHILNIYKEQELEKELSMRKIGNSDFSTKPTNFYNLDIVISVGYRVKSHREQSLMVFKTIQNKMHWAIHGETAAETVYKRVDSTKEHIGLTNFKGEIPTKKEVEIAKNYLAEDELNILNRMVTAFLEIAEIQALDRTPMYMADWIKQLDTFLKMTNKDILQHSGTISHQKAIEKAHSEYEIYKEKIKNRITQVEKDFIKQIEDSTKRLKDE